MKELTEGSFRWTAGTSRRQAPEATGIESEMQPSTRTDHPYAPLRAGRWPARHTPRWVLLAGIAMLLIAVAVAQVHKPTQAERAADLRGFLQAMNIDIESCAGGVGESLTALHAIQDGASRGSGDVGDAISVARTGAANCSPANNEQIDDLESYQAPESLDSYHLDGVITGLVAWAAPDAEQVQTDVAAVLAARGHQAKGRAELALQQALTKLDGRRATADSVMVAAIRSLAARAAPPRLPG
jgi:hypothetical protein